LTAELTGNVAAEKLTMSGSESGSDGMPMGNQGDLASRNLVLESKRYYLDVKENQRGRFTRLRRSARMAARIRS